MSWSYFTSTVVFAYVSRVFIGGNVVHRHNHYAVSNVWFYKLFCLQNIDIEVHFKDDFIMLVLVCSFALGLCFSLTVSIEIMITPDYLFSSVSSVASIVHVSPKGESPWSALQTTVNGVPTSAFKVDPLMYPTISGMSRGAGNNGALFIISVLKFRESHQQI